MEAHGYHQRGEELELQLMIGVRSRGQGSHHLVSAYENLKERCRPFLNGLDGIVGGNGHSLIQQAELNG